MGQAGRPKLFKSRKALIEAVDRYFNEAKESHMPLTLTGLARSIGMKSRQTLINYKRDEKFGDIVCDARMKVEEYAERRLYDRDGARGAEFNLKFNFGWGKETEEDKKSINEGIIALAELINKPRANRNIADFEGEDDE